VPEKSLSVGEMLEHERTLLIQIPAGAFYVTYCPAEWTIDFFEKIHEGTPKQQTGLLVGKIKSWTLTNDDGTPFPLDATRVSKSVPYEVITTILRTVSEDCVGEKKHRRRWKERLYESSPVTTDSDTDDESESETEPDTTPTAPMNDTNGRWKVPLKSTD
jgi:hypothetical protein